GVFLCALLGGAAITNVTTTGVPQRGGSPDSGKIATQAQAFAVRRTRAPFLRGSSLMTSSRSEARDLACSIVGPRQILRPLGLQDAVGGDSVVLRPLRDHRFFE